MKVILNSKLWDIIKGVGFLTLFLGTLVVTLSSILFLGVTLGIPMVILGSVIVLIMSVGVFFIK